MARPKRGQLQGAVVGGALGSAFGRKGALAGALLGLAAFSHKLPLDEALQQELGRRGYRSVTVVWTSAYSIRVIAASSRGFHQFDSEVVRVGDVGQRLDELYESIVRQAQPVDAPQAELQTG